MKHFPEINALNLRDALSALDLAYLNLRAVKPSYRTTLNARIKALLDRVRRLRATEKHIKSTEAAQ
jgi:hypothetical protein